MKNCLALIALLSSFTLFAEELPKDCLGLYAGEMSAYTVVKNDVEMSIQQHDVKVQITRQEIFYTSGTIALKGGYTFLKQSGNQYLIKVNLSNGKSISYQLDLIWNKKARSLFVAGKNGEPDVRLDKLDV